ncbi:MAG: type II secretion system minor pseudopilin GspK [Sphingomonas sp.]|nr:type II secretion system minor pseudopilin GspK [Sphingomonas sp.]
MYHRRPKGRALANKGSDNERGAALLTVLLLVAVIAVLAGHALERMRLATRLGANAIAIDQARAFAMAAETAAMVRINTVLARDAARVTLQGDWAGKPYPLPIPGGIATATVTDGGNCFNLNGLVQQRDVETLVVRAASIDQFAQLMRVIGIPDQQARSIAAASADWIDTDNVSQPDGAEDADYSSVSPRYLPANTLMTDPSELRAVSGVTPAIYAKLRPWICTLPVAKPTRININTLLPEQAPLLAMLLPDTLDISRARAVLLERPVQGFTSTVAFWQGAALKGVTAGPEVQLQTAVTTQWFGLKIDVALGGTQLTQTALIDATEPPVRLVSRAWSDPS